jgi:hypothetical protein
VPIVQKGDPLQTSRFDKAGYSRLEFTKVGIGSEPSEVCDNASLFLLRRHSVDNGR